jgi:hypothetical protein
MLKHLLHLSFVVVLAVLIVEAGCGNFFDQHHGCGACAAPTFLFASEFNSIAGFTVATSGTPSLVGTVAGPNSTEGIVVDKLATFCSFPISRTERSTLSQSTRVAGHWQRWQVLRSLLARHRDPAASPSTRAQNSCT